MLQEFTRDLNPGFTTTTYDHAEEATFDTLVTGVRQRLGVTAAQEPIWQSFADVVCAVSEGAAVLSSRDDRTSAARFCIIQSIEEQKFMTAAKLAALERLQRAACDLYWVLLPHQRPAADRQLTVLCTIALGGFNAPPEAVRHDS